MLLIYYIRKRERGGKREREGYREGREEEGREGARGKERGRGKIDNQNRSDRHTYRQGQRGRDVTDELVAQTAATLLVEDKRPRGRLLLHTNRRT